MNESPSTELTNTAYDILKVLGKDDNLNTTLLISILKMHKSNRQDLVEMWQVIKKDRQKHIHMLKEALRKRDTRLTLHTIQPIYDSQFSGIHGYNEDMERRNIQNKYHFCKLIKSS